MSFHEAWINGLIAVFDCDRATAESLVANWTADELFTLAAEPSQILSLFTYPVHPDYDDPDYNLSFRDPDTVTQADFITTKPFGFNLNYFLSVLKP